MKAISEGSVGLAHVSAKHSYGFGCAQLVAALVNGLFMLAVVTAIIVQAASRFANSGNGSNTVGTGSGQSFLLEGNDGNWLDSDDCAQLSVPWHGVHGRKPALKTIGGLPSRVLGLLLDSGSLRRRAKRRNER